MSYSILEALHQLKSDDIAEEIEKEEEEASPEAEDKVEDKKEEAEEVEKEETDKEEPLALRVEDYQKWVDYDMEHYGEVSERTNELIDKAGFQIVKDDHGDYEVVAGHFE